MAPEGQDITEHLTQKYGTTPAQQAQAREAIRQRAPTSASSSGAKAAIASTTPSTRIACCTGPGLPSTQPGGCSTHSRSACSAPISPTAKARPRTRSCCAPSPMSDSTSPAPAPSSTATTMPTTSTDREPVHRRRHPLGTGHHHQRAPPDFRRQPVSTFVQALRQIAAAPADAPAT